MGLSFFRLLMGGGQPSNHTTRPTVHTTTVNSNVGNFTVLCSMPSTTTRSCLSRAEIWQERVTPSNLSLRRLSPQLQTLNLTCSVPSLPHSPRISRFNFRAGSGGASNIATSGVGVVGIQQILWPGKIGNGLQDNME